MPDQEPAWDRFARAPQMPWRTEHTKGHGSDCTCEWCFRAPPLPTVEDNLDGLAAMAKTLQRIEKLLQGMQRLAPRPLPPPTKATPAEPPSADFL